ncbi:MAG: hypothetical protein IBX56_10515, partial [Methylomicrobium sp.]|nr:hypothetical protein [Methylomicrobium sp.]
PPGASLWVVLRRSDSLFTGLDDIDAITVYSGNDRFILDTFGLLNGEEVFYRVYYFDGETFISESETRSAIPGLLFTSMSNDPLMLIRDRLDLGLQDMVAKNTLFHPRGAIPVLISSPLLEQVVPPLVTLHLGSDISDSRGIGELLETEDLSGIGDDEGWLSSYQIDVIGWSTNADERNALRNALKHLIIANLPIFEAAGMSTVSFQVSDSEDFQSYQAPMYMANGTLRFVAPTFITMPGVGQIIDVQSIIEAINNG